MNQSITRLYVHQLHAPPCTKCLKALSLENVFYEIYIVLYVQGDANYYLFICTRRENYNDQWLLFYKKQIEF